MQNQININIAVDVIKALSEQQLENNIYMMDDSILESSGQGTERLCTLCKPGQTIRWTVYALDLQTPVVIRNISFAALSEKSKYGNGLNVNCLDDVNPDSNEWAGVLPLIMEGHKYNYHMELQMGKGRHSCLVIDAPSLMYINSYLEEKDRLFNGKNK